ncbi:MAG TPA: hypothetical protein VM409_05600 [Chloroflexia bacterium]|nr:hypothetical protein [Chloroflexia bacterium]
MAMTEPPATGPAKRAQSTNLQAPRVVKCPTPQCPGWITIDSTRHQTEPCRYCRVGVDTLRFLLSRVGAEHKALPVEVHEEFNRLMLTMAGAWGQNVYLRPVSGTLVDLKAGQRGVVVEYNPALGAAGEDGPAPLVGIILHKLLHFEAHLGQKPVQITVKSGSREKEGLVPLMSYLLTVTDHAWVSARLEQLNPLLYEAQSRWGLDLAQMLVGSESMFNRYLSERNLLKLTAVLQASNESTDAPGDFRSAVMDRLATQTSRILEHEKDETRRLYLAVQLANVRLMNPDAYAPYQQALTSAGFATVRDSASLADRVAGDLSNSPVANPPVARSGNESNAAITVDHGHFQRGVEAAVRALGMGNFFEVKG